MNFFGISCFTDSAAPEKNLKASSQKSSTKTPTESKISNELAMSHYNLGCAMQEQGKLDEAIINYRNAIAEDASFCDAHYNLANGMFYINFCCYTDIVHVLILMLVCVPFFLVCLLFFSSSYHIIQLSNSRRCLKKQSENTK